MASAIGRVAFVVALLPAVGCGEQARGLDGFTFGSPLPTSPSVVFHADPHPDAPVGGFLGDTLKETLSGPAIDGVVPEGEALADVSEFLSGGSTILTVRVKNVNLPDGTVLGVTLDFTPVGTITLDRREGTLRTSLGHFAPSNDEVRVRNGETTILIGAFFR